MRRWSPPLGRDFIAMFIRLIAEMVRYRDQIDPRPDHRELYDELYGVYRGIYGRLEGAYKELQRITGYPELPETARSIDAESYAADAASVSAPHRATPCDTKGGWRCQSTKGLSRSGNTRRRGTGSFRSILKWGSPHEFKEPNERLYTLMKRIFKLDDEHFSHKINEGHESVPREIPTTLAKSVTWKRCGGSWGPTTSPWTVTTASPWRTGRRCTTSTASGRGSWRTFPTWCCIRTPRKRSNGSRPTAPMPGFRFTSMAAAPP